MGMSLPWHFSKSLEHVCLPVGDVVQSEGKREPSKHPGGVVGPVCIPGLLGIVGCV